MTDVARRPNSAMERSFFLFSKIANTSATSIRLYISMQHFGLRKIFQHVHSLALFLYCYCAGVATVVFIFIFIIIFIFGSVQQAGHLS